VSTIELIVTIAIFILISTAILVSYPQLNSQLSLDKTAQEIASSIHETRMYGIGIRSISGGTGRTKGYGVHFYKNDDGTIPNSYILFNENVEDNKYTSNAEKVLEYKINAREQLKDICVTNNPSISDDKVCDPPVDSSCLVGGSHKVKSIDILFLRPAPTVFMNGFDAESSGNIASSCTTNGTCSNAEVIIGSPNGKCKKIQVWTTGQVTVISPKT
jgi:hypothetical protein